MHALSLLALRLYVIVSKICVMVSADGLDIGALCNSAQWLERFFLVLVCFGFFSFPLDVCNSRY